MLACKLTDNEFAKLSTFIHQELGIKMPPVKKTLLEARLQKRLRVLDMGSFKDYCDYLFGPRGADGELVHMIDLVTTNKTDFFREPGHFDFLERHALQELACIGAGVEEPLRVWSAGCSTGEEPYTLAIVLSEFGRKVRTFDFSILATDISTRVLEMAAKGIYGEERIEPVPDELRKRYFLRSKDPSRGLVRAVPELRQKVSFMRLNFMDEDFAVDGPMDIIFCRNVVIYFEKETQERLFSKFCDHLRPGGYLCIGHSESLHGFGLPLKKVDTAVYRRLE